MRKYKRIVVVMLLAAFCATGFFVACKDGAENLPEKAAYSSSENVASSITTSSDSELPIEPRIAEDSAESSEDTSAESSVETPAEESSVETPADASSAEASEETSSTESVSESSSEMQAETSDATSSTETPEEPTEEPTEEPPVETLHTHVWQEIYVQEATCSDEGAAELYCECGLVEPKTLPSLGHVKEAYGEPIAPTCQQKGRGVGERCSRCKEVLKRAEEIATVDCRYEKHFCVWCNKTKLKFELSKNDYICTGIKEGEKVYRLYIPDEYKGKPVKEISENAFAKHYELVFVSLGKNIETIAESAFGDCRNIAEVYDGTKNKISEKFKGSLDCNLFVIAENNLLKRSIYTEERESAIVEDENGYITYTQGDTVNLIGYSGTSKDLVVPENVTAINSYMFRTVNGLRSVIIGENVTTITQGIFSECCFLRCVSLPKKLFEANKNLSYCFDELSDDCEMIVDGKSFRAEDVKTIAKKTEIWYN